MNPMDLTQVEALVTAMTKKGIVALNYCDTEPSYVDINHFQLMKQDDEQDPGCFNSERIPIDSDVAKDLLHKYLNGNDVIIYPLSLLD
jgi:hypothetical protein